MVSKDTGATDRDNNPIHVGDIVESQGTLGPIRFEAVELNEDGFHGFYLEEVRGFMGMTRTQRVALDATKKEHLKIIARVR